MLVESISGCGTILTGSTNGADAREWTSETAFHMIHASPKSPLLTEEEQSNVPHFYEAEDLGCAPPKLCNDCKMFPLHRLQQGSFNHEDSQVVREVQENTWLDEDFHCIRT